MSGRFDPAIPCHECNAAGSMFGEFRGGWRQLCPRCGDYAAPAARPSPVVVDERAANGSAAALRSPARRTLRLLDMHKLLTTEPEPVDWVVEGIAARGTLTLFAGLEKKGKSLICAGLAAAIATGGGTVAGIECAPGSVLIIDAENGEREAHRRARGLGLDIEHVGHVHLAEARGFDLRRDLDELRDLVAGVRPDLVVLDSFRSLWGGRENDSDEVAAVLDPLRNLARESAAACVLIHHTSKDGVNYRGSSAIGASVENVLLLKSADDDPDRQRRYLRNPSCRFAEEAGDRWMRINADAQLGAIYIDRAEPPEGEHDGVDDAAATVTAPVRDTLALRLEPLLTGNPTTQAALARILGRDPKDQSVRRALAALNKDGRAERLPDGGWVSGCQGVSTPRGRDTATPWHPGDATPDGSAHVEPGRLHGTDADDTGDAIVDRCIAAFDAAELDEHDDPLEPQPGDGNGGEATS